MIPLVLVLQTHCTCKARSTEELASAVPTLTNLLNNLFTRVYLASLVPHHRIHIGPA